MFALLIKPRKTNRKFLLSCFLLSILGLAVLGPWIITLYEPRIAEGVVLEGVNFGGLTEEQAKDQLTAMANILVKWPKDAQFLGVETLQEEVRGKLIAIEENLLDLLAAPPNTKLKLKSYPVEPMVSTEEVASLKYGLATSKEFHFLETSDLSFLEQINKKLYNQVIYPGEEFSLNSFLTNNQDRTEYPQAVTQLLARSLYHCIVQGDLQVTEKWETQEPKVGSATVDNITYGLGRDLKFINNLDTPILIRSSVDEEVLKIWFLTSTAGEKAHIASLQASTKSSK